ncbi:sugar transporter [Lentithecium fluviatile CBS 122367]|uniref:Sugar transporter n=1 Tax=Lentithecium fluviatile CBS 122367 TaxID=1168545 RepID=A0A6G1JNI4_9PLEO|nr:sugar transporter [Lentithecium fluviatile CBS 122367]
MWTLNPFKKHDVSEFPGVLVPLDQAPHGNSATSRRNGASGTTTPRGEKSETDEKSARKDSDSPSGAPSLATGGVGLTLERLRAEIDADMAAGDTQTAYDRKAKVINRAIADMGMGRYQWELFFLCGCGWMADNLWLQGIALTLTSLSKEFGVDENQIRYTTLALFLGLCIGASFWGTASDVIGRRLAFNFTLFLAGAFGLAASGGPNWIGTAALYACIGLGVGGNLPVDGALFLEFIPCASGALLTLLSAWWPIGQLISSLLAWAFIPNFECAADAISCTKSDNMGWRYLILSLGAITFAMFCCRFFLFHLYESPKFLLSRGRQSEAVATIHGIAYHNKTTTWITEDILNQIGGDPDITNDAKLSTQEIIKRSLSKFSTQRIGPLFKNKQLAITTCLLWFQWATIGMGYPLFNAFLPQYLANSGSDQPTEPSIVYRNYAITSVIGVPGSFIAYFLVDIPWLGRRRTMAIASAITGVFIFLFTISGKSNFQLAFSCLEAFFQNIMYGVLYAYTPEVFPAPNRGTGSGIASFMNRIAGLCAPIVAVNAASGDPKAPIYASGGLILAACLSMLFLPIETQGKQTL